MSQEIFVAGTDANGRVVAVYYTFQHDQKEWHGLRGEIGKGFEQLRVTEVYDSRTEHIDGEDVECTDVEIEGKLTRLVEFDPVKYTIENGEVVELQLRSIGLINNVLGRYFEANSIPRGEIKKLLEVLHNQIGFTEIPTS